MAGHMGTQNATVKHSVVVAVDPEKNLLTVKGGVPGHPQAKVKVYITDEKIEIGEIVRYGVVEKVAEKSETPAPETTSETGSAEKQEQPNAS